MRIILLALQLGIVQQPVDAPVGATSVAELHERVDSTARAFLERWRFAWQEAENDRHGPLADERSAVSTVERWRSDAIHCHWVTKSQRLRRQMIIARERAHATCPVWTPADEEPVGDERRSIDAGVDAKQRWGIGVLRSALRQQLDVAALQLPGDLPISRQRVRFALDANDLSGAAIAALSCDSEPAGCGLLQGLVLYRAGLVASADSAFRAAARLMPERERCEWNDVRLLLDEDARGGYEAMPCAARTAMEARVWWLSDPMYLEPGNERRAEHFARKVMLSLVAGPANDQRIPELPRQGSGSVAESMIRYGWPAHMFWGGASTDYGHDIWLRQQGAEPARPYVLREYTHGRLHTVPLPSVLREPFAAAPGDWVLNEPPNEDEWWPVEHYARDASRIVQLPEGQTVMLRRRERTRYLWAATLDTAILVRSMRDSVRAMLFRSRSETELERMGSFAGRMDRPLLVDALLPAGPALFGIEMAGDSARPAARTRFGATVIGPLMSLSGGRALSQPMLFDPGTDRGATLDADEAASRMLGSTTLTGRSRFGVYWEAYGFPAGDSVEIRVELNREDRPGFLKRVSTALRLGSEESGNVGMRWRELPATSGAVRFLRGEVPVQMRSIVLDVSQLTPGHYRMSVSLASKGGSATSGDRTFELR
ncbi:MAG: hypothetical protein H0W68_03045 [Gemmatimonadaceae bacterium]|nr:hypothetical protein [Gemmatimonadaceae bacterium]